MDKILSCVQKVGYEFGRLATSMDSTGWLILGFGAFVVGVMMLRGNVLRAS